MIPIYKQSRIASLFFVIYLIINTLLGTNLVLSFFYIHYKNALQKEVEKKKDIFQRALDQAADEGDDDENEDLAELDEEEEIQREIIE
eukprot:CAMPEP_0114577194 /NCGR_PEP_ID=MMETSP0125-20121206/1877_1 /TAXON_ID=485358 ORGANISM="Aristerostoma sp., Strain ATCC 50986" /NCGR_SAMPLE_ID=MMETSP0125 /ASSEMBLY_ACC=CAM_ASM_000245 /LENGTH=87 /DNA_ID=CAMNT_0001766307 /DNA_START=577 /DNA_END=840 /DNA_ORIENTATION=+